MANAKSKHICLFLSLGPVNRLLPYANPVCCVRADAGGRGLSRKELVPSGAAMRNRFHLGGCLVLLTRGRRDNQLRRYALTYV